MGERRGGAREKVKTKKEKERQRKAGHPERRAVPRSGTSPQSKDPRKVASVNAAAQASRPEKLPSASSVRAVLGSFDCASAAADTPLMMTHFFWYFSFLLFPYDRGDVPLVAPGVFHRAHAMAVGLVGDGLQLLCAGGEGALLSGVGIVHEQVEHGRHGLPLVVRLAHLDGGVAHAQ